MLILLDGWEYLHRVPTPTIVDNLLAAGQVPPLVVLFVRWGAVCALLQAA